jgi:hypothetical protein
MLAPFGRAATWILERTENGRHEMCRNRLGCAVSKADSGGGGSVVEITLIMGALKGTQPQRGVKCMWYGRVPARPGGRHATGSS